MTRRTILFSSGSRFTDQKVYDLEINGVFQDRELQERLERLNVSPEEKAAWLKERLAHQVRVLPRLSLSLRRAFGSISYDGDDIRAKGISTLVLERLKYRTSVRFFERTRWLFALAAVVLFLALDINRNWRNPAMLAALTVSLLLFVASLMPFVLTSAAVLKLEQRSQRTNFFVRKDEITLALLMAVVGAILGVGSTLFIQSLKRQPPDPRVSNSVVPQKR